MPGANIKCTYVPHKSWMEELLGDLGVCMKEGINKNMVSKWELNLSCPCSCEHSNICDIRCFNGFDYEDSFFLWCELCNC